MRKKAKYKNVHVGDIWWADVGVNVGNEQDGGILFERPVLVICRINYFLALVIPLTSQSKPNRSLLYHQLIGSMSTVLISQMKVMSTKRLKRKIHRICDDELSKIKNNVSVFYKL